MVIYPLHNSHREAQVAFMTPKVLPSKTTNLYLTWYLQYLIIRSLLTAKIVWMTFSTFIMLQIAYISQAASG